MRKVNTKSRASRWEAAGGIVCFLAGILAGLLGALLSAGGWIVGAELHPWIHAAGTVLLIVTIPLVLLSGFCLDWAEQGRKPRQDPDAGRREMKLWQ